MPYFMNWDDSCNKDVDDAVTAQVMATTLIKKLPDGKWPADKFVLDTPKNCLRAYRCVMDPLHSSGFSGWLAHKLRKDTLKCLGSKMMMAVVAHGAPLSKDACDDRAVPNGHRHSATQGERSGKNGGLRIKRTLEEVQQTKKWFHPETQRGREMRLAESQERYNAGGREQDSFEL
jgi:hypothetical protein